MIPLTDALRVTEDARPGSMAHTAGRSPDPAIPGDEHLDPIRVTRDDPAPGALAPATLDVEESSGPEAPGGWWLEPLRATRDDPNADAAALGLDFAASEKSAPERSEPAGAPFEAAGAHPGEAGVTGSATPRGFDSRNLPRGRGTVRRIGAALSLLAVLAAAGGGGTFLWKTELVRPALVRRLPPVPVPVMDLSPVHAANAAVSGTDEPADGAAARTVGTVRTDGAPVRTDGATARTDGAVRTDGAPVRTDGVEAQTDGATARTDGAVRTDGAPVRIDGVETQTDGATARTDGAAVRTWERPVVSTPVPEPSPPPAPSTGLSAAETPGDPRGTATAEPPAAALAGGEAEPRPSAGSGTGSGSGTGITIRKRIRAGHVAASLQQAYRAFLAGDGESAAQAYRTALGHEPGNRDARLGLAAVAARAGRWEEAAGHYARLLASHPADTVARAALISIDEQDPARGESRMKALLHSEPRAAHLHFNLGNLYAAQSRWPEAQQSYFNAYRFDRGNADYAYNLAVSLDHLSQSQSALWLYREALVLSRSHPAGFTAAAVRQRIRDLATVAEAGPTPARAASETAVAPAARNR